jgi:hypothetical protein
MTVEQSDHFEIKERTRPQGKGAASAPAEVHAAIVGEKEDRTMVLSGKFESVAKVSGPADFIEAFVRGGRLPLLHDLFHPAHQLRIGNRPLGLNLVLAGSYLGE